MDMFEKAVREKLTFKSIKGDLLPQDLFDVKLKSNNNFDLDTIAKTINKEIREESEESFVTESSPSASLNKLRLDIVKHVIAVKLKEKKEKEEATANRERKQRILEILDRKSSEALEAKSEEELRKELESL
jgi:hypothetical protein